MNPDAKTLIGLTRDAHEAIRRRVGGLLERARLDGRELASLPGAWGAGDIGYALDDAAEAALEDFGRALGEVGPVTLIAEGPGERRYGSAGGSPGEEPLRVLVDPIDGTRALMLDMRSGWVLTGLAPDAGPGTRLSDVTVAVQTELPTTWAGVYHVLTAVRGQGATIARHDVRSGELLDSSPLVVPADVPLDNGMVSFMRYLPAERPHVVALEHAFYAHLLAHQDVDPHLLYEDLWLCTAGQLFLTVTGRYRMLADLRGWLGRRHGLGTFTSKPYDLATLLVFQEAGLPVFDAAFAPLDAPLDTSTELDVIAFGNKRLRAAYEPSLRAAMETVSGSA